MLNKVINFEDRVNAETVFFFGLSEKNGKESLFRNCGNPYTCKLRSKFIVVDKELFYSLPNYCYLKLNTAVEKEKVFIVTDADLLTPKKVTKNDIKGLRLVSRPDYAIKDTIQYCNAKSKLGDIDMLIVKYKMHGLSNSNQVFFDCYLFCDGQVFTVETPNNIWKSGIENGVDDYSTLYFKDFELIDAPTSHEVTKIEWNDNFNSEREVNGKKIIIGQQFFDKGFVLVKDEDEKIHRCFMDSDEDGIYFVYDGMGVYFSDYLSYKGPVSIS